MFVWSRKSLKEIRLGLGWKEVHVYWGLVGGSSSVLGLGGTGFKSI